ncbi:uncharacterized protein LOC106153267 [Lingula anatina]|uniref:Uncharacterized protein LOC106153267 n=1 Tax=Lingula anatina TaxID=7574 RepID=A0A1S3H9A3_LINAN|nr:uncharacterized protein LOC106153267 [Lingula anatina]|eukprot:XP_013382588.1 uncharacterized protein LOC106153267 [Lingula anatina]
MPEQDNTSPLHHFAVVSKPNEDVNGKDPNQIKKERKVKTVVHHTDPDDNKYVYYFEDSSTEYYAARPDEVDAALPKIADKAEMISRRIALEFFGVLRLIVGFFIIFVVELYRFVMRHILHPILVGILVVTGDYLIKPVLSAIFNGILQPVSIFLYNLFVALRTGLNPLIDIINGFARQVAVILGAFRLVVVNNTHNHYERHVQDV